MKEIESSEEENLYENNSPKNNNTLAQPDNIDNEERKE